MVKEPIEFIGITDENRKRRSELTSALNEPLFYTVDVVGKYKQLILKYRETAIWYVTAGYNWDPSYRYNDNPIDRQSFILMIRDVYPEYFEWFLFHPEWLP